MFIEIDSLIASLIFVPFKGSCLVSFHLFEKLAIISYHNYASLRTNRLPVRFRALSDHAFAYINMALLLTRLNQLSCTFCVAYFLSSVLLAVRCVT